MKRILISSFLLASFYFSSAQTGFNFKCARDTVITNCATTCIDIKTLIPDLRGLTTDYVVNPISSEPGGCFQPYFPPDVTGTSTNLVIDDRYSSPINLGFNFPFYGTIYTQLVASINGYVSFDITKANGFSHYQILRSATGRLVSSSTGTPEDLPSTLYDRAIIMGAYQDLNPNYTSSPDRRIDYTTVGTAPYRKWILTFYKIPQYHSTCHTLIENTQQIILHESSGIIEVFIYSRESCPNWNRGRAMIGIQNYDKDQAVMAPGRAASDAVWQGINMNESWRFTPAAGESLLKRVELYDLAGNLVSTGTTVPSSDGYLEASFSNVCSPAGTTAFVVRPVYQKIDDPSVEVFGSDTIRVVKNSVQVQAAASGVDPSCTNVGSLTATPTSGVSPFEFSLNGGAFQSENTFNGLDSGTYVITVKDVTGCTANVTASLVYQNDLTVTTINDTTICAGESFTATTASNSATSYSWSPSTEVNDPAAQSPVITPTTSRSYTVTATLGNCIATDVVNVTVNPSPQINAGTDQTILEGDVVQLQGSGSAGSYLWTPSMGLSSVDKVTSVASPNATTTYTLQVTNNSGCTATDDVTITVIPYCVQPMEAFTPNGDGMNDVWLITNGNCLKSARVQVFNRYGNIVFETQNYSNNWDGNYKGKPLPDGTYYYIITYHLINNKPVSKRGNVTILR